MTWRRSVTRRLGVTWQRSMIWRRSIVSVVLVGSGGLAIGLAPAATAAVTPTVACAHHVASDFNGDGYADIAAGEPFRSVASVVDAGAVRIVYGSALGVRTAAGGQYIDQTSAGIAGTPTLGADFGLAVAAGFFNDDCYADLAIGAPGADTVTVLYGSATGLSTLGNSQFGGRAVVDGLGFALAAGDINGDGRDDIVASAPYADDGAGEITTMLGGPTVVAAPTTWISQATPGVPGLNETGDIFGFSLTLGDFNGDHRADVAIGVPFEDDGGVIDGGSVTILYGTASGLGTSKAQSWTQDVAGVPGAVEAGDEFGYSLAAGDVTGDGISDLVIGAPGEDEGTITDSGSATFLRGSASGLTATRALAFTQNTAGVPGGAEHHDSLGIAVAVGDFNGDGHADVALGVPGEDLVAANGKTATNGGVVDVLRGTAAGPTGAGATVWDQDSKGVPGAVETGDEFGTTLMAARIRGGTRFDLVIGAQLEDITGFANVGAITVLPGTASGLTGTNSQTFTEYAAVKPAKAGDEWSTSLG